MDVDKTWVNKADIGILLLSAPTMVLPTLEPRKSRIITKPTYLGQLHDYASLGLIVSENLAHKKDCGRGYSRKRASALIQKAGLMRPFHLYILVYIHDLSCPFPPYHFVMVEILTELFFINMQDLIKMGPHDSAGPVL